MKRAVVIADGRMQVEAALGALASAGFEAVAVRALAEVRPHLEAGATVVVAGAGAAGLEPGQAAGLGALPTGLRRSCVVVLVGAGLVTGDGFTAFLAGVDLVVGAADAARLGELAGAAVAAKRNLVGALDPAAASHLGG